MGAAMGLLAGGAVALGQPDYAPAHYVPPVGCTKWYTTGYGHHFCVIHDMEGYYWNTISYLNACSVSASIYYMVNGLQNGSDNLGHKENNPSDPPAGDMTQSVREQYYAWHVRCWNRYMFGTEHEGFVATPVWYSEAMYKAPPACSGTCATPMASQRTATTSSGTTNGRTRPGQRGWRPTGRRLTPPAIPTPIPANTGTGTISWP